jgi:hypothetical protein
MHKRSFLALIAVTVVVIAAAIITVVRGDRAVSPAPHDRPMFPELAAHLGDLAWMRLEHGAMRADFAAIGGHWAVVEKGNYPADEERIRHLLLGLADLTLLEPKTQRPDLFSRLDVDDPTAGHSTLVSLQDRTGTNVSEVIVGKSRKDMLGSGNDGVYLRKPGEQQTWLARGSLAVLPDVKDWLDRSIIAIPPARIVTVRFTGADGDVLTLQRGADGKFAVVNPPADAKFKAAALATPANALDDLELDDVRPAAEQPMPQSGVATAMLSTMDGLTITARVFAKDNVDWLALSASGGGKTEAEAKAVNARVARWSFAIPADRAKMLRTRLGDLVEPAKGS